MAVTNQELILGGGVILLILYSMMGKKDEKEQRVVTWVDPRPPDAPEKHVDEMSESEEPLKKKKTFDDEMNDRMQNMQSTLTEIISRTNGLAQKLNIVARSTGVVGEVLKLSIIGITKRIDDFLEDIAQFRRTFQVGHQFEQYLTPWTNEALKYHHGLQAIIINSEHYKTRGDILQAIQVFTTAFLQMHPQKGQGEGYYLGGAKARRTFPKVSTMMTSTGEGASTEPMAMVISRTDPGTETLQITVPGGDSTQTNAKERGRIRTP